MASLWRLQNHVPIKIIVSQSLHDYVDFLETNSHLARHLHAGEVALDDTLLVFPRSVPVSRLCQSDRKRGHTRAHRRDAELREHQQGSFCRDSAVGILSGIESE